MNLEDYTVKELLDEVIRRADFLREHSTSSADLDRNESREYSLCITAAQHAQMRFTRGLAMRQGKFKPADLEADGIAV